MGWDAQGPRLQEAHEAVSIDSTKVEAKEGEAVGYDGFKRRKGSKIHACVDGNSMPLSVEVRPGDKHDSKELVKLVEGLT